MLMKRKGCSRQEMIARRGPEGVRRLGCLRIHAPPKVKQVSLCLVSLVNTVYHSVCPYTAGCNSSGAQRSSMATRRLLVGGNVSLEKAKRPGCLTHFEIFKLITIRRSHSFSGCVTRHPFVISSIVAPARCDVTSEDD